VCVFFQAEHFLCAGFRWGWVTFASRYELMSNCKIVCLAGYGVVGWVWLGVVCRGILYGVFSLYSLNYRSLLVLSRGLIVK
jgi:hypothetical protein